MRSTVVEHGATVGATLGVNLYDADGNVLSLAALVAIAAGAVIAPTTPPLGYAPLQSVQAGAGIDIDATDPLNPIISATGGSGGVLPVTTGEVPAVLVYLEDGTLVYEEL